jgi:heme A synthase
VSALALLVAGSLVNSRQAALSVPDWPTSYGRLLLTSWPGNTAYEQIHR